MPRSTANRLTVQEVSGNQFANLLEAQQTALHSLKADVAITLRAMLARGILIKQDGKVAPSISLQVNP